MIRIHPERCVHQQCAVAQCQACVQHCPVQAWSMNAAGLGFDDELCDGCGLCVAACSTEAIALQAPLPAVHDAPDGVREAWLACDRVAGVTQTRTSPTGNADHSPKAGSMGCLHALSAQWLMELAQTGVRRLRHVSGDCATCTRQPSRHDLDLIMQWRNLQNCAASGALPMLQLVPATAQEWQQQQARSCAPDVARRRFFGGLLKGARQVVTEAQPVSAWMTSGRTHVVALQEKSSQDEKDGGTQQAPLWAVALDPQRCTWCRACVALCPQQAIVLEEVRDADLPNRAHQPASRARMVLNMARCTGCNLCVDVCDQHALQPEQTVHNRQCDYMLEILPCRQCKTRFYRLDEQPETADQAREQSSASTLCPVCQQGRVAQFNRLIETQTR